MIATILSFESNFFFFGLSKFNIILEQKIVHILRFYIESLVKNYNLYEEFPEIYKKTDFPGISPNP